MSKPPTCAKCRQLTRELAKARAALSAIHAWSTPRKARTIRKATPDAQTLRAFLRGDAA